MIRRFSVWLILFLVTAAPLFPVLAKTEAEYEEEIKQLEAKITAAQSASKTLAGQISLYDDQIALTSLKIEQTSQLINSLNQKMDTLEHRLRDRSQVLQQQIVQTYKGGSLDPAQLFFSSIDFSAFISQIKYTQLLQNQNRRFLHDTQVVQSQYASQVTLIQDSQKKLTAQKTNLSGLRESKNNLLRQTKNDEATYQRLLAQAISERNALKSFAQSKGGQILPPQPSPDGWYFNQRDERWGRNCIGSTCSGSSPSYVWEVGCLITSVTMMRKKNGDNINPGDLARNPDYFFQDLMLRPFPAQEGYKFTTYDSYRPDLINSELDAGRPVIVGIRASNASGGRHFLVLKSRSGSGYIMNDPWEGPDLQYTSFYNLSNILNVTTYTRL